MELLVATNDNDHPFLQGGRRRRCQDTRKLRKLRKTRKRRTNKSRRGRKGRN